MTSLAERPKKDMKEFQLENATSMDEENRSGATKGTIKIAAPVDIEVPMRLTKRGYNILINQRHSRQTSVSLPKSRCRQLHILCVVKSRRTLKALIYHFKIPVTVSNLKMFKIWCFNINHLEFMKTN